MNNIKAIENNLELEFDLKSSHLHDGGVLVKVSNVDQFFDSFWLRDHCRCEECYNSKTFQRSLHLLEIPNVPIIEVINNKYSLSVVWEDGHKSAFDAKFLFTSSNGFYLHSRIIPHVLWNGEDIKDKVARVTKKNFLETIDGEKKIFMSLLEHGVAFVTEVEATLRDTENVCRHLGPIQNTLFGDMYQVSTELDFKDTAYSNVKLAVHNDNTYFTEAAGLEVLHCLEHIGTGGETLLADGFYGAEKLKLELPEHFKTLTNEFVEAQYIGDNHHHRCNAPVITLDPITANIKQIRYNVYDRSTMRFSSRSHCRSVYSALKSLADIYENPSNQWKFKLVPGTMVIFDNFRVLHGRESFTGRRVLCGAYTARGDWLSRARALGLLRDYVG